MTDKPMRVVFGETLRDLGTEYPDLVVLDADVSSSTQTKLFGDRYPERFYNFGIAENNMMSAAAGMAASGLLPVVSSFAFLLALRAGDPVRSLLAYNKLNVKLAGGYAGLSDYADGASHQAVTDIAVMRAMPNFTVLAPTDAEETRMAVKAMLDYDGPVYLRLSREAVPSLYGSDHSFSIGRGVIVRKGIDVTLVATGATMEITLAAADILAQKDITAQVVSMPCIKPLDEKLVLACAAKTGAIVTIEEHTIIGGLGSAVCETICASKPVPVVRCGLADCFGQSGEYEEILACAGLDADTMVEAANKAIANKNV